MNGNGESQDRALDDLTWKNDRDEIVFSPRAGGRVISWRRAGHGQLVHEPELMDGGLLRVILCEERYPGASYNTPHRVLSSQVDETGFRLHLRYYWKTSNAIARLCGWPGKVNPCYLDGLLLDKTVAFDATRSIILVHFAITNISGETRVMKPWLHSAFCEWVDHAFVVSGGRETPFKVDDVYWAGHRADPSQPLRIVQARADDKLFAVLGGAQQHLAGMFTYVPKEMGPGFRDATVELRYLPVSLADGECWRTAAFLAVTDQWRTWASEAPGDLFARIERVEATDRDSAWMLPLLNEWALPEEQARGLMPISFLDKVPFTSARRFAATGAFAGFQRADRGAQAHVALFALRDFPGLRAKVKGRGWRLIEAGGAPADAVTLDLQRHTLTPLILRGPADLRGKASVRVTLTGSAGRIGELHVAPDAVVEPEYAYQVKQVSTYYEERFQTEKGIPPMLTAAEFRRWQARARQRHLRWLRQAVKGICPLKPRLVERQLGPRCIRDKILIQTEPGMWIPSYVVYPRKAPKKMPALLYLHGSGPGKQAFAPDEEEIYSRPATDLDLPSIAYRFARDFGCLVYVPDQRGWGEWAESNHVQAPQRGQQAGFNILALMMWDHLRAIDYLCARPDVDSARIGCFGSSGGGQATIFTAGIDERVAAAMISSTFVYPSALPEQYFHRMAPDPNQPFWPPPAFPAATVQTCALTIPRALWIIDGTHDICWLENNSGPDRATAFARARARLQAARDELARLYTLMGAPEKFRSTWFEGDHCAGFTYANCREWFGKWLRL